jgi:hypothetical protein
MISKRVMSCDGRCDKAFGATGRPRHHFSGQDDDYVYLPDRLVGSAPPPGHTAIYSEGDDLKPSSGPLTDGSLMNRWCARECERRSWSNVGEPIAVKDMEDPRPNMPHRDGHPTPWSEESPHTNDELETRS